MAELFLELFSEEIPARMQGRAAEQLRETITAKLKQSGLFHDHVKSAVTPRRLVLTIDKLSLTQEDRSVETRGPRVGAPDQALEGFLRSVGLKRDQLQMRDTEKGEFYFAIKTEKGKPTRDILKAIIEDTITNFHWPKSMRWGTGSVRWVRPMQNIACIFGGDILPIKFGDLTANDTSRGHRFLSPEPFRVTDYMNYLRELKTRHVMLELGARKEKILRDSTELAARRGLSLVSDDSLLEEVAGLVEWPNALMGTIENRFMLLPEEVLISSIRTHQKYFCTRDSNGKLASTFIVISNMSTNDNGAAIVAGNECVLRARLSDAAFFWQQDLKTNLADHLPALDRMIFHAKLGSVAKKVSRIEKLSAYLAKQIGANSKHAVQAASLCKADLATEMVGEFPELQGIMGRYYALEQGLDTPVATAIAEHYKPTGAGDSIPTDPISISVALADKIDSLVGLFAAGEKPTGSKDPFALRRSALGILRIILDNKISLNLNDLIKHALKPFPTNLSSDKKSSKSLAAGLGFSKTDALEYDIKNFIIERLKHMLKADGTRHDLINAIFATGESDMLRLVTRVNSLSQLLTSDDGINLLAAYRRAANILSAEEKKDGSIIKSNPSEKALKQAEETALFNAIKHAQPTIKNALKVDDFSLAINELSKLRAPVDAFFNQVTVNADDNNLRQNRLRLLANLRDLYHQLADFNTIEG